MSVYISYEQLDQLIQYAIDGKNSIDLKVVQALAALNTAVQNNIVKELTGTRKRNTMLKEQLERKREARTEQLEEGNYKESGLDSADVATALLYQLQQLKTYKLSKYKVDAILYEMYASWLYSKGERLCVEHPVATEYGPRFWHALKRLDISQQVSAETWKTFAGTRPDLAAFCKNAAQKYYDISLSDLQTVFMNTKAYKNASASNNGGKWNKEIADTDIYTWKTQVWQVKNVLPTDEAR